MKRRKFATAAAFIAALLAVALAASTTGAATSKSSAVAPKKHASMKATKGNVKSGGIHGLGKVGVFSSTGPKGVKANPSRGSAKTKAFINQKFTTSMRIPGKVHGKKVGRAGGAAAPSVAAAVAQPRANSLPVKQTNYQPAAIGLGSFEQWYYGGYALTPPDNALAEGNGFVVQAVNNLWQVLDTNFQHVTNVESTEQFFAPAIIDSGYNCLSDPKAHYDNKTRKWYLTEVAYDFFCDAATNQPGSAVFIAVSTTSDPLSQYNMYVLDTSFDGSFCDLDGCLADQPLLGMNQNALFISTNSYDWDSCELVGPDCVFNGTQLYVIDSTALAAGFAFPNLIYADIGNNFFTPDGGIGCGTPSFGNYPASAFCIYSLQPSTSPGMSFNGDKGGIEFGLSAEDFFGSVDTGILLWAITNTSSISAFIPGPIFISYTEIDGQSYGFPATDTPFFAPWAEQPASGSTPACDVFYGPFCTPTAIDPNDDRMLDVKAVKVNGAANYVWGELNTKVLVRDPIGHDHRRVGAAWWSVSPTLWGESCGFDPQFICDGKINDQGIVANWNNDILYPAIGVDYTGRKGAMVYTLTGNTNYPDVAVSKLGIGSHPTALNPVAALRGKDLLDDLSGYFGFPARFGDYSAAVGDGHSIYLAAEFVPYPGCDADEYLASDGTCNGTRNFVTNYGTGLVRVNV